MANPQNIELQHHENTENLTHIANIPLNKARLEALSDGVFAIVMTLLVIEIKVPNLEELHVEHLSASELFTEVSKIAPLFLSYFISVAVLAWVWLSHHFLFHYHAKTINRTVVLLNILFLSFVALIPFSSHLLGSYFENITATIFYGINLLLVTGVTLIMYKYIWSSKTIENGTMSSRVKNQAEIRMYLTLIFTILGIVISFIYAPLSYFFYGFPIVFNIVPGLLDLSEKIFGFRIE